MLGRAGDGRGAFAALICARRRAARAALGYRVAQ